MKHPWPITFLRTVDSTNNYANSLLTDILNIRECVISASHQTNGRGQKGNSWISQENQNLTFSVVLNTSFLKAENQFALSQAISLGIVDFLNKHTIVAKVKWPNDILVKNSKIAGILIENGIMGEFLSHSIVGIGLNINQCQFDELNYTATSMKLILEKDLECNLLLEELLNCLNNRIDGLKSKRLQAIHHEYICHVFNFNQWARFSVGKEIIEAKIIDITSQGELVILSADGKTKKYLFQEIKIIFDLNQ